MVKLPRSAAVVLLSLASAVSSSALLAQSPTFGVESTTTYVVTAWDMVVDSSTTGFAIGASPNAHRYLTAGGGFLSAIHVPQGALLLSVELEACDSSATGEVEAVLYRTDVTGPSVPLATVITGNAAMPGCNAFAMDIASPETVDNAVKRYIVVAGNTSFDGTTTLGAVRVRYRLQVSAAPGNATFNDVPIADPAFQFIEALAASGITAGCGGGNYCPDAPLTRRQMAVFLSKALGLHWLDGIVTGQ